MNLLCLLRRTHGSALLLWLACILACSSAGAQGAPPSTASERSVKAAYIYRFLSYVEWPASVLPAREPVVIGVVSADELAQELESVVRSRAGEERRVVVRRLGASEAWTGVHVLYVPRDIAGRAQQVIKALQDQSVLTISDADGAVERGFTIGFVQVDSRLRFEVNAEAADRSGLKLSSRLLTVALRVRTGTR